MYKAKFIFIGGTTDIDKELFYSNLSQTLWLENKKVLLFPHAHSGFVPSLEKKEYSKKLCIATENISVFENSQNTPLIEYDVLFFSGGDPLQLKNFLLKAHLVEEIKSFCEIEWKIVIWNSAGAIVFFEKFMYSEPANGSASLVYQNVIVWWLGIFPWLISAHLKTRKREKDFIHYCKEHDSDWIAINDWQIIYIKDAEGGFEITCDAPFLLFLIKDAIEKMVIYRQCSNTG